MDELKAIEHVERANIASNPILVANRIRLAWSLFFQAMHYNVRNKYNVNAKHDEELNLRNKLIDECVDQTYIAMHICEDPEQKEDIQKLLYMVQKWAGKLAIYQGKSKADKVLETLIKDMYT